MIGLLAKQLFRSKGLIVGLLVLFSVGILSVYVGGVFVDRQKKIVELTEQAQAEHVERHVEYIDGHVGLLLYYIRFGFVNDRSSLTGLSIGQRDLRQAAQLVNIRNLEEQKNTSEFLNPFFQLLGNLDLSFVILYLFPLIIISLCFNVWSEEKESGRWPLLYVQGGGARGVILSKLLLRVAVVLVAFCVLLFFAVPYLSIPFGSELLSFVCISILYLCFWFSLSWWVISLGKSSQRNAVILLSSWIFINTILPAMASSTVAYIYPIPESYETTIDSRDGYHTKWDQAKEPTIEKFKQHYPQFEMYNHPEDASFSWFWYYAMQQMGDDESLNARLSMKDKLKKRNELAKWIGYFVPSIHTQLSMNTVCGSDMGNYLRYMDALEVYHEDLRLAFYPDIFDETPIEANDWSQYGLDYFVDNRDVSLLMFLPLLLIDLILLMLAYFSFSRIRAF